MGRNKPTGHRREASGEPTGRPPAVSLAKAKQAVRLRLEGIFNDAEIARMLGIKRPTLLRLLAGETSLGRRARLQVYDELQAAEKLQQSVSAGPTSERPITSTPHQPSDAVSETDSQGESSS